MKKTLVSMTLLFAMALVGNCRNVPELGTSTPEPDADEKITIYYGRVSCPNKCPAYEMTIRPDGSVEYEGKESTRVLGKRTYKISAGAYREIIDAIKRARVDQLADEYPSVPGRDEGTVILRLSWPGKTKQIVHFIPSRDGVPEELTELEMVIVKNGYPK